MSLQLKLNNSGSWKTILHDVNPAKVEAVQEAVLKLLACDRSGTGRACWKIDRESLTHPGGERLWVTQGFGAEATWRNCERTS